MQIEFKLKIKFGVYTSQRLDLKRMHSIIVASKMVESTKSVLASNMAVAKIAIQKKNSSTATMTIVTTKQLYSNL